MRPMGTGKRWTARVADLASDPEKARAAIGAFPALAAILPAPPPAPAAAAGRSVAQICAAAKESARGRGPAAGEEPRRWPIQCDLGAIPSGLWRLLSRALGEGRLESAMGESLLKVASPDGSALLLRADRGASVLRAEGWRASPGESWVPLRRAGAEAVGRTLCGLLRGRGEPGAAGRRPGSRQDPLTWPIRCPVEGVPRGDWLALSAAMQADPSITGLSAGRVTVRAPDGSSLALLPDRAEGVLRLDAWRACDLHPWIRPDGQSAGDVAGTLRGILRAPARGMPASRSGPGAARAAGVRRDGIGFG